MQVGIILTKSTIVISMTRPKIKERVIKFRCGIVVLLFLYINKSWLSLGMQLITNFKSQPAQSTVKPCWSESIGGVLLHHSSGTIAGDIYEPIEELFTGRQSAEGQRNYSKRVFTSLQCKGTSQALDLTKGTFNRLFCPFQKIYFIKMTSFCYKNLYIKSMQYLYIIY